MIESVRLYNFRNYGCREVKFRPGINVVIGDNGLGKTNLLEAVFYLLSGCSMRTSDAKEMIRRGEKEAILEATLRKGREIKLRAVIGMDGAVRARKRADDVGAVCFQPDDLYLLKGGPEVRRRYIDDALMEIKRGYKETLREYQRVLRQRNESIKMVRRGEWRREAIRGWNPLLYRYGSEIVMERMRTLAIMELRMSRLAEAWEKGAVEIKYYASLGEDIADEERAMERLERAEETELRRGATLIGPHRDEVVLRLGGRNARRECSQGEQKLVAIMWRIAQAELVEEETGREVLLMMDDCLAELDKGNRAAVMDEMGRREQVVITATDDMNEFAGTNKIMLEARVSAGG